MNKFYHKYKDYIEFKVLVLKIESYIPIDIWDIVWEYRDPDEDLKKIIRLYDQHITRVTKNKFFDVVNEQYPYCSHCASRGCLESKCSCPNVKVFGIWKLK